MHLLKVQYLHINDSRNESQISYTYRLTQCIITEIFEIFHINVDRQSRIQNHQFRYAVFIHSDEAMFSVIFA